MTYCVGVLVEDGLVFAADSRTNAGVDHVATFRKLAVFEEPGERFMVLMGAGNLATTQAVVTLVGERLQERADGMSLFKAQSMFNAAGIVGAALREVLGADAAHVQAQHGDPNASFILGGQIHGRPPRLFQVYSAGNFIEATPETPFFQIGETKYGKPILDRIVDHGMDLGRAAKVALLSFDSTMRSNLSVGPPIDLLVYRRDSFAAALRVEIMEDDPYFQGLRRAYGAGLAALFEDLPEPDWSI